MWLKFAKTIISDYTPSLCQEGVPSYYVKPQQAGTAPDESSFNLLPQALPEKSVDIQRIIERNLYDAGKKPMELTRAYNDGFVDPEGNFYQVRYGAHGPFTREALWGTDYHFLEDLGWASVHNGDWFAPASGLTQKQRKTIEKWAYLCTDSHDAEDALNLCMKRTASADQEISNNWSKKQKLLKALRALFPKHNFSDWSLIDLEQLYLKVRERMYVA